MVNIHGFRRIRGTLRIVFFWDPFQIGMNMAEIFMGMVTPIYVS